MITLRVNVRCVSADMQKEETIGLGMHPEATIGELMEKVQNKVRGVPPKDLIDLFYPEGGRLDQKDLIRNTLHDGITIIASQEINTEPTLETTCREDPIIGIRLVTAPYPPLHPGQQVHVLRKHQGATGASEIYCQNLDGCEGTRYPAWVVQKSKGHAFISTRFI